MTSTFIVQSNGQKIISRCSFAKSFFERFWGLIPYKNLAPDQGLLFMGSCQQMHSFFMRFPIEVFFLDENKKIIKMTLLKPWRLSPLVLNARYALETTTGVREKYGLSVGQQLEFDYDCP